MNFCTTMQRVNEIVAVCEPKSNQPLDCVLDTYSLSKKIISEPIHTYIQIFQSSDGVWTWKWILDLTGAYFNLIKINLNSTSRIIERKAMDWRDSEIKSYPMPESRQPRAGIPLNYPFCAIRESSKICHLFSFL